MENKIKIFEQPEFGSVRILEEEGRVLFCGNDVARALGYLDPRRAVFTHCKDGRAKRPVIDSMGREQLMTFIPEGDVYRLIVNSKLPAAQKFESWVFDEVLPSIRKQGYYILEQVQEETERLSRFNDYLKKIKELELFYTTGTNISRKQYIKDRAKRDEYRQLIDLAHQGIEATIEKIEVIRNSQKVKYSDRETGS